MDCDTFGVKFGVSIHNSCAIDWVDIAKKDTKIPMLRIIFNIWSHILVSVSAAILAIVAALPSHAHEVIPAVADVRVSSQGVDMSIRLTAEAILAGIDLSAVIDTNDADQADEYDRLRALDPDVLAAQISENWGALSSKINMTINDARMDLTLTGVEVDPVGDLDVARYTVITAMVDAPVSHVTLGWAAEYGGLVVRQADVENGITEFMSDGSNSQIMTPLGEETAQTAMEAFASYVPVGFDHIIPKGLDHILFVLGLFFLSAGLRALIWQISAFTLAHTVTLAAGALGWVVVSPAIVEPLIAASIVFVAVENIAFNKLNPWRPLVIFGFGLLHGLGFASVLGEFGLPQSQFIPALIGFNVGVEIGQLTIIAIAFLAVELWFRGRDWYRARVTIPASAVIAAIGAWWFIERVFL